MQKVLRENIVRRWYPACLDRRRGGYFPNIGPGCGERNAAAKTIVSQAGPLWLFARLAREGYVGDGWGPREMIEAAEWGYVFLREKMWDGDRGGFYWEVDAGGAKALEAGKFAYSHALALQALSECYLAGRRKEVLRFAATVFETLERRFHDRTYGGYLEARRADWSAWDPPTQAGLPTMKTLSTHLRLLEAMAAYYRASKAPAARERLIELITIAGNTAVRKDTGASTNVYTIDWLPVLEGDYGRVSYGQNLESIRTLMDACEAAGLPLQLHLDLYRTLYAYVLRYGYDAAAGGFYESGPLGEPAGARDKVWWTQAEGLVCSLRMYQAARDPACLDAFLKTWAFTSERLLDRQGGEWFEKAEESGAAWGGVSIGRAERPHGEALLECLRILRGRR